MKRVNIFYWISTILFAALMLVSVIPDMLVTRDATKFMAASYTIPITPIIGPQGGWIFMLIWFIPLVVSYNYYHKRLRTPCRKYERLIF